MTLMKLLLPLTAIAALAAGTAFADCTKPDTKFNIPNGSKAAKEEMLATQAAVKTANTALTEYSTCLLSEQDAELAKGGDALTQEQRDKIVDRYTKLINEEVDRVKKIADKFNAEVKAFKAKSPA
jgi:pyruvate/2-oxoacid:ferredoxin oxidoreductase beta subunit